MRELPWIYRSGAIFEVVASLRRIPNSQRPGIYGALSLALPNSNYQDLFLRIDPILDMSIPEAVEYYFLEHEILPVASWFPTDNNRYVGTFAHVSNPQTKMNYTAEGHGYPTYRILQRRYDA